MKISTFSYHIYCISAVLWLSQIWDPILHHEEKRPAYLETASDLYMLNELTYLLVSLYLHSL